MRRTQPSPHLPAWIRVTLVDSNFTTGNFTGGKAFLRNSEASAAVVFAQCDWQAHGPPFQTNLTSNQSHSNLFRSTVKKAFHHGHASYGGNGLDCVIFQSTLGRQDGDLLHSEANRTWVTYSTIHHAKQTGGSETYFIGNSVITDIACEKDGISISGFNCAATINNNHFYNGGTGNNERVFLEDNAQKSLRDESFQEVKTITMPYPILINRVQNDLHAGHNWGGASCYVQFNYSDGSNQNSNTNFNGDGSWNTYYYSNPQRGKPVISVKIYLKQFQDAYLAYEKNDKILIVGGAICIPFSKDLSINNNLFRDIHKYGYGVLIGNAPSLSGEIISNIFWHSSEVGTSSCISTGRFCLYK